MSAKQKQYEESEKEEIRRLYEESKSGREQKRLLCIKLRVVHGKKAREIAEITGYSEGSIKVMISAYGKNGATYFLNKQREANYRKLTKAEEKEVLDEYTKLAMAGQILVVSDLHKAFEAKGRCSISKSTTYNILSRHNWRKIMPRSRHPKKVSEDEIQAFKKNQ